MKFIAEGSVTTPLGFKAGSAACGLKKSGALDLALVYSERDCAAAGVFTTNQLAAAPVLLDRDTLAANATRIRGVAANSGNANACTGEAGRKAAAEIQRAAAELCGCRSGQILVLSTGYIGLPLPVEKVKAGLRIATNGLSDDGGIIAAQAIMTTDTRPKYGALEVS